MSALPASARRALGVWLGASGLLGLAALLAWPIQHELLDWQPQLALTQPWRLFSAAAVHYTSAHLLGNLAGLGLVATLGCAARVDVATALAWVAAWPLTHIGLLIAPDLAHYGGLSGVLHAGVAVLAVQLLLSAATRQRGIGALLLLGLATKVGFEFPWSPPAFDAQLGMMVARLAHASGLVAGVVCACAAHLLGRARSDTLRSPRHA